MNRCTRPYGFSGFPLVLLAGAVALMCGACGDGQDAIDPTVSTVRVTRGNLRLMVTEGGELESANPTTVRSEVEGRTTILWLVPEGTQVNKGEVVVKLDGASLQDRLEQRELEVEKARSDLAQAREAVEIQKKRNSELVRDAQTKLDLATNALGAYREGTYLLELRQLEAAVTLAKERHARAKDEAEASARLFEQKYLSRTELEADLLGEKQAAEAVNIAEGQLEQLQKWERTAELLRLESDVVVNGLALERVQQQARSELAQQRDTLASNQRNYDLLVEHRDKILQMLKNTEIVAPSDGLVVYSRERSRHGQGDPVSEGKEVGEREEILLLPDLSSMLVMVDIHESSVKRVMPGQKAVVEVDALPGRSFTGTVSRVSPVPSSQSSWMNPDLRVYETKVTLDENIPAMKPGMHARVQIKVAQADGVLQVPLQAVHESGIRSFVYVKENGGAVLREVEVGLEDAEAVEIVSGLEEGEEVYVVPPATAPRLPEPALEGLTSETHPGAVATPPAAETPNPQAKETRESRREGEEMSPEEREALRERTKGMSAEEKAEFLRRRRLGLPDQE